MDIFVRFTNNDGEVCVVRESEIYSLSGSNLFMRSGYIFSNIDYPDEIEGILMRKRS